MPPPIGEGIRGDIQDPHDQGAHGDPLASVRSSPGTPPGYTAARFGHYPGRSLHLPMSPFVSGSAWAMARDISNGHMLVTDRTLKNLTSAEIQQLSFELERLVRDLRGEKVDLEDIVALRDRNRKLSRLTRVAGMVQHLRMERR